MKSIAMCLCVLFAASVSQAGIIRGLEHYGTTPPSQEGWVLASGAPSSAHPYVCGDGTETWQMTMPSGYYRLEPADYSDLNFDVDWSLDFNMRYQWGSRGKFRATVLDGEAGHSFTWDDAGSYYYIPGAGDTLIPGSDVPLFHNTFHDYGMAFDEATGDMTYSMDGVEFDVLARDEQNPTTATMFYWGCNAGSGSGSALWHELTYEYAPEPSTAMLMVMGLVGVCGWRRRRQLLRENRRPKR